MALCLRKVEGFMTLPKINPVDRNKTIIMSIMTNDKRIPNGVYCREENSNVWQAVIYFRKPKYMTQGEYGEMVKLFKDTFYKEQL